jgi:hypothetical protein
MRKRLTIVVAMVAAFGISSLVLATEFRSPLISERGPMRYVFEDKDEEGYRLRLWSACHFREAHKAFMKHGMSAHPLTKLFFGKSEFRLSEIFPNSRVPIDTELYNPFMRILKIKPRATYYECGATLGGRIDFQVWENKGRLGLRAAIPFRQIEMEREDQGERDAPKVQDVVSRGNKIALEIKDANGNVTGVKSVDDVRAYRLDLVEALPQNMQLESMVHYKASGDTGNVQISDNQAHEDTPTVLTDATLALIASCEGFIPRNHMGAVQGEKVTPLPANLVVDTSNVDPFVFNHSAPTDYSGVSDDNNPSVIADVATRLQHQATKATLWVTDVYDRDGKRISESNNGITNIENALKAYQEGVHEWMADRGYVFETSRCLGIGDIDLDLFYEHRFCENFVAELMLGIRFPTGWTDKYYRNPYEVHTGNGDHWEVKLGGMAAWQALKWLGLKLDLYWSFVLDATEHRCAAFKGAQIKNIGPEIKTDVDWGYLVLRFDLNFFHPKTDNLSSTLGYEFYYKTEDNVSFKCAQAAAWFGRKKSLKIEKVENVDTPVDVLYTDLLFCLDKHVMEKSTEAIGHKIRWESSYRFSEWFEGFCGLTYTFAGQNLPREIDCHCGLAVKF